MTTDVWIIHSRRVVICTDLPGVPADAVVASDGTVGGTVYRRADHHSYRTWGEAVSRAHAIGDELGYDVEYESSW